MAVLGRLAACLILLGIGASMVVHSHDGNVMGYMGSGLFVVGLLGLIDLAVGG